MSEQINDLTQKLIKALISDEAIVNEDNSNLDKILNIDFAQLNSLKEIIEYHIEFMPAEDLRDDSLQNLLKGVFYP